MSKGKRKKRLKRRNPYASLILSGQGIFAHKKVMNKKKKQRLKRKRVNKNNYESVD